MKKIIFILSIVLFINITYAQQKIMVTGKVIDSITHDPIEFATVSFKNGKKIVGTTTDSLGNFSYVVDTGVYTIKIEFLSYKTKTFLEKEIKNVINLDTIYLALSEEVLDEIEIVANKKLMEFSIDKKTYNASKDIANKGGTALDVLGNISGVQVNDIGLVLYKEASTTILIDGKPFFGLDYNADTESLKAIPSSTIEKVEIISRSAKYDAGKVGAILNIITKKQKKSHTNGAIKVNLGSPDNNGISFFINDKTKRLNIFSTIAFNNNTTIIDNTNRQTLVDNSNRILKYFNQKYKDNYQKNSFIFSVGSDFYLNKNNTLTTSIFINTIAKNYDSDYVLNDLDNLNNLVRTAQRDVAYAEDKTKVELYLNYTTLLDTLGQQLSIDLKYSNTDADSQTDIDENNIVPIQNSIKQKSEKDLNYNNFLAQIDYTLPLLKKAKLDFGYKNTIRKFTNDFNVSVLNNPNGVFAPVPSLVDKIEYSENIHAFYGVYSASFGKLKYNIGLRTEISDIALDAASSVQQVSNHYFDLFPSAKLSYDFINGGFLSIDYHRGTNRPNITQLNPFSSYGNERILSIGNPELRPSYKNYLEIMYGKEFKKVSFSSSVYFNFATDYIQSIILENGQNSDGLNLYIIKPINNGTKNIIGFDTSIGYRLTKKIRFGTYISPYNMNIINTMNKEYDFNSWVLYTSSYALFSLSNGLRFQVSHVYQSKKTTKLTTWKAMHFSNLSIKKSLFKNRATLAFKIKDVFNSKSFIDVSNEANALTTITYKEDQKFLLSFSYRFNQKRRSSKNRSNDVYKDDLEKRQGDKL